jgi:hypothetical protein
VAHFLLFENLPRLLLLRGKLEYLENVAKLKEGGSQLTLPSYTYIVSHAQPPAGFRVLVKYNFCHLSMGILSRTRGK